MVRNLGIGAAYVCSDEILINDAVQRITGYDSTEIRTLDEWFGKLFPHDGGRAREDYEAIHASGQPLGTTFSLVRKDGGRRMVELSGYRTAEGELWLLNDVTERMMNEEKFRLLFEHSAGMLTFCWLTDRLWTAIPAPWRCSALAARMRLSASRTWICRRICKPDGRPSRGCR